MKSQYLEPYKSHVLGEISKGKKPYSVGTFLVYRLRGNAKSWLGRYLFSLIRGLEKDGWQECKSKLNGRAFMPPS
jgi:hypothetical protein